MSPLLSVHGTIMKVDSSIFALTQIDKSVRKILLNHQKKNNSDSPNCSEKNEEEEQQYCVVEDLLHLNWESISHLINLYGSSAERQFLHTLISLVVKVVSEGVTNNNNPSSAPSSPTSNDSSLVAAQKLLQHHYHLDFSKPVVSTALNSAFESSTLSPTEFLRNLAHGFALDAFAACVCCVTFANHFVSSSSSDSSSLIPYVCEKVSEFVRTLDDKEKDTIKNDSFIVNNKSETNSLNFLLQFIKSHSEQFQNQSSSPLLRTLECRLHCDSEKEEEEEAVKMALDPESNGQVLTFDPGVVDFVLELGPAICATVEECRATLSTVGPHRLTPAVVARIMVGMLKAQELQNASNNSGNGQSQNIWGDSSLKDSSSSSGSGDKGQSWNGKVFIQAVLDIVPNLKWTEVFHELDFPGFYIKDGRSFRSLMEALRYSLHLQGLTRPEQFPIDAFYKRWNNTEGQLSLIKCCLNNHNTDVFSFADYPYHSTVVDMLKTSGDKSYELKEIQQWKSIELLELLMWLSDAGHYQLVHDLFQFPVSHCPDILLIGLVQLTSPINLLRQDLMTILFPIFLNNHGNSAVVLQHAWHAGAGNTAIRPIMIHAMSEWYLRGDYDQTKLSRILDVAQDLKALPHLLNATSHVFIIDLACLASRREFLKLDKWLSDKIREHGEVFIVSLIKVLNRRVPFMMGKDSDSIPKTAQLPPETVNTMIQCLHQCVGKVSPEVSESILTLVTTYNVLMSKARPNMSAAPSAGGGGGMLRRNPLEAAFANPSPSPGPTPGSPSRLIGPNFGGIGSGGGPPPPISGPGAGGSGAPGGYSMLAGLQMGGPNSVVPPSSVSTLGGLGGQMNLLGGRGGPGGGGGGPLPPLPGGNQPSSQLPAGQNPNERRSMPDTALLFNEIQPGDISKEAEDEANSYFHRIYSKPPDPTMSIDEVIELLKRFQDSSIRREREVFTCMLRNLFEEYKFFPQYPEQELHTTAQLFGGIIEHGLVSTYLQLGVALRFVVEALKKPPGTKMYFFGLAALDRFKTRLKDYPQYCQHLSTIPHFSQFPEHLIEYVECGARSQDPPRARPSVPSTPSLPPTPSSNAIGGGTNSHNSHNSTPTPVAKNALGSGVLTGKPSAVVGSSIAGRPSIANATNITTLLMATEKEDKVIIPPESVQDKTAFIFNNLNQMNLIPKCDELKEIIGPDYWPWVAQYLVMKRASIELNFHTLYSNLLDTLRVKELNSTVLRETHRNIRILLKTDKSAGNFSDRQLLKNLGHWLGMITVMKNKPILLDDLDIKSLIIEAYRKGLQDLLYVVPFAAKIMESCARSLVFKPPCPWTMAILNVLAELHREPDMKLNLKFEIEVLCKALSIEVSDLKPKGLLKDDNAFKIHVKQLSYPHPQQLQHQQQQQQQHQQQQQQQHHPPPQQQMQQQQHPNPADRLPTRPHSVIESMGKIEKPQLPTPPPVLPMSAAPVEDHVSPATTPGSLQQGGLGMSTTPTLPMGIHEPKFSYMEIDTSNLNSMLGHIAVNNQLPLFQQHPGLKQYIRPAVEKAIQDLVGPVVERSIKYTINACDQIVKKDFALDHDENRMRVGAHHMMRYLTAGMAMITSRDHIFIAISSNLKQGFLAGIRVPTVSQQVKDMIDQASQLVAQENMELACVFIQKTAVEKALVEIDKRLSPEYECRKLAKSEGRRYYDSVMMGYQSERIPEPIRVKPVSSSGPVAQQLAVYEDFSRNIPGFLPPAEGEVPFMAPKFPPSNQIPNLANVAMMPSAPTPGTGDELVSIYEKLMDEIQNYYQGLSMSHTHAQLSGGIRSLLDAIGQARSTRSVVAAIALLQKAVEGLLEGLAQHLHDPEIIRYRDAHLMVLKALQDTRAFGPAWVNRQVTKSLIEARPELKYNIEAVDTLIRASLVNMLQFDANLATSMEKGTNLPAVIFSMELVKMYLIEERFNSHVSESDLYHTVDMLARCSTMNRHHPEGLVHLIEALRNTSLQPAEPNATPQQQQQQPQQQQPQQNFVMDRAPGGAAAHVPSGAPVYDDPQVEKCELLLREWVRMYLNQGTPKDSSKPFAAFIHELNSAGILKNDESICKFFRNCVQCVVTQVYQALQAGPLTLVRSKCYQSVDALVRLVALLIRHIGDSPTPKVNLMNKFLGIVAGVLIQEHDLQKTEFQQLPFHRMFMMLFYDLNAQEPVYESISMQVLTGFSNTMHILNPIKVPGFAYAWLEIIGNRLFIARMLALASDQKCWAMYCQLILDLFKFLYPFLRNAELAKPVATLYRGTLRVLLVILHDFPDFLCDYCYHFLDAIPPNCIQMRNLVLSAFPRNMRLPDPFTANLKFELLPDSAMPPRILSNVGAMIQPASFKKDLDSYLKARGPVTFLSELRTSLQVTNEPGTRYNIPLINALVLYVGSQHIQVIRTRNQTPNMSTIAHASHMDIFQNLAVDLDTEGRYLFLNALANQLRFPSSHTHYFSLVILYLFAHSNTEDVQEQITRVLLERLVVNRPHPWGLLVTFIELIKNPAYKFWQHDFVHCAPEVEKLFESVARSCMVNKNPPPITNAPGVGVVSGGGGAPGSLPSVANMVNSTNSSADTNGVMLDNSVDHQM